VNIHAFHHRQVRHYQVAPGINPIVDRLLLFAGDSAALELLVV
jgi:hypothetical protein